MAVIAIAVIGGLALALSARTTPAPVAPSASPRVLAPNDASLVVDGHKIEQMPGSCDAQSCFHVPPTKPVIVRSKPTARLAVSAGQSTLFTVGAYNLERHNQPVPVSVQPTASTAGAGNDLVLDHVPAGRYQVTVSGQPNGGMWQFTLIVKK